VEWALAYLALGAFVGFFAGLFGIGGGLVMVPMLVWMLETQHLGGAHVLHLALGTSMAAILFTSLSSARTHHAHDAVNLDIVRRITPGLFLGTLCGALLASRIPALPLTLFFALFVYFSAAQMLLQLKPKAARTLPGTPVISMVGILIGAVSSLVSVGGGVMSVPFMLRHNVPLKQAIGTSAALGFPIALGGTLGYIVTGYAVDAPLPDAALGFVYLPALIVLALGSLLTTHLGARAAHRLPLAILRRGFALLLFVLATRLLLKAII
jgi:uncharacterized membrane protein YfcA